MDRRTITTLGIAAALAGAVSIATLAATTPAALAGDKVKCYGVSKAGENDCANAAGTHSCAGQAAVDYDGGEWRIVDSADFCLADGGMTDAFAGVNQSKV